MVSTLALESAALVRKLSERIDTFSKLFDSHLASKVSVFLFPKTLFRAVIHIETDPAR
jgi:hypothetical protein